MNVMRRIVWFDHQYVNAFPVEMKDARLTMIDPNERMKGAGHITTFQLLEIGK